ncbi:MAG TPA: carboxynorspermidine decarboxylase, partial [Clostridia bacterium]
MSYITDKIKTPYYIIDEKLLLKNLEILQSVKQRTGCKILLAQKAFSSFYFYPLIAQYLDGVTASGLYEAKLGYEKMGKENHIFSPAYTEDEFDEIVKICGHIVFNSIGQLVKFKDKAISNNVEVGLRVNPEISTQDKAIYDPCAPFSRLGVTSGEFFANLDKIEGISGLHFHTLCEQNSDALEITLAEVERRFGGYFNKIKWINFGGGHHITRQDYDIDRLVRLINYIKDKYNLEVYLEPGEAVVLDAGFLVSSVIDIIDRGKKIAILDASAACHMPDVLEMPYRPRITGEGGDYEYRLGGPTCLAGDVIGDYKFKEPLKIGDKIIFEDMALYT